MHAFDVLGDPVRRRILELIADGELTSGAITAVVQDEFGISQPAVSQHLKVLRDSGFATVRPEGTRRLYAVDAGPFRELDAWLDHFRRFWASALIRSPPSSLAANASAVARPPAAPGRETRPDEGHPQ
jgi:DNA-binding transcriptional ArsR family regulator